MDRKMSSIHCVTCFIVLLIIQAGNVIPSVYNEDVNGAREIADDLIERLKDYNSMLRPNFGGDPVAISVELVVRNIGPVSSDSTYASILATITQTWVDERIATNDTTVNIEGVRYDSAIADMIWTPDSYVENAKDSIQINSAYMKNGMVVIKSNGEISVTTNVKTDIPCTVVMDCYPWDVLPCQMHIGSRSYTTLDATYYNSKFVYMPAALITTAFSDYKQVIQNGTTSAAYSGATVASYISLTVYLQREVGIFIFKTYMPCVLIVILSWINFWISRSAVPARAAIGITTVLTMTTITSSTMQMMPDTNQLTPVDEYVGISFIYVVAALIEFAVVEFYSKGRLKYLGQQKVMDIEENAKPHHRQKSFGYYLCWCTPWSCSRHGWHFSNRLDQLSRIIFPLSYCTFNFIYWVQLYLKARKTYYHEERDLSQIISVWDKN